MKKATLLNILLVFVALASFGCGKTGLKDPVFLPGTEETFLPLTETPPAPKFSNGDIVRCKMLPDKVGIMMSCDYKYLPNLKAWYCIVDFYPSSAAVHLDFSQFDNYERRYVYEFELELASIQAPPAPKFGNGDIVRYRMLPDKQGIIMSCDHEYLRDMKTWYCIVDFYPSSALIHFDFSELDNYERRYVYEFELELVKKYSRHDQYKRNRWIR